MRIAFLVIRGARLAPPLADLVSRANRVAVSIEVREAFEHLGGAAADVCVAVADAWRSE